MAAPAAAPNSRRDSGALFAPGFPRRVAMDYLLKVDWAALFVPKLSLLEILIRGVAIYVGLCLLLRVVLKRQAGKVSLSDLLVITLVAGVCRNPLVADAYSIPDGLGVVAVVLLSSYATDFL